MEEYIKEKENSLLKYFLAIIILSSLIGIVINVFEIYQQKMIVNPFSYFVLLITFLIFFLSIYCLFHFRGKKLNKITFVLPIINIILPILLILVGTLIGIISFIYNTEPYLILNYRLIFVLNFIENIFELVFATILLYLLRK